MGSSWRLSLVVHGVIVTLIAASSDWLSRPGHLEYCVGDTASFNWTYDSHSSGHVSMIFWIFLGTKQTIMGWYDDRNPLVYEHYQGRAFLMDGANAGIVLYNLSEADSGQYQVELSGPGHIDKAHLQVYNVSALAPTLTINEQLAELGQDFNATNMRTLTLTLNTSALLYANITIHVKGFQHQECDHVTSCSITGDVPEDMAYITPVITSLIYDICPHQRHRYTTNIILSVSDNYVAKKEKWRKSLGAGLICASLIMVMAGIIFYVVIWIKPKRRRRRQRKINTPPLTGDIPPPINDDESKSLNSEFDEISMKDVETNDNENSEVTVDLESPEQSTSESILPKTIQWKPNQVDRNRNKAEPRLEYKPVGLINMNAGVPCDINY